MSVKATRSVCGLSRATCPATDLVIDLATRDSRGVGTFRRFPFTSAVDHVGTWNEEEEEDFRINSEVHASSHSQFAPCKPASVKSSLQPAPFTGDICMPADLLSRFTVTQISFVVSSQPLVTSASTHFPFDRGMARLSWLSGGTGIRIRRAYNCIYGKYLKKVKCAVLLLDI